jgi:hypothetical protein
MTTELGVLTIATLSALETLGIDLEDFEWQDLSICQGMDVNLFFDSYEANDEIAKTIDQACLSCPVMTQCLQQGVENGEWGVWGGVFLVSGKQDKNRNSHKTEKVWKEIKDRLQNAA